MAAPVEELDPEEADLLEEEVGEEEVDETGLPDIDFEGGYQEYLQEKGEGPAAEEPEPTPEPAKEELPSSVNKLETDEDLNKRTDLAEGGDPRYYTPERFGLAGEDKGVSTPTGQANPEPTAEAGERGRMQANPANVTTAGQQTTTGESSGGSGEGGSALAKAQALRSMSQDDGRSKKEKAEELFKEEAKKQVKNEVKVLVYDAAVSIIAGIVAILPEILTVLAVLGLVFLIAWMLAPKSIDAPIPPSSYATGSGMPCQGMLDKLPVTGKSYTLQLPAPNGKSKTANEEHVSKDLALLGQGSTLAAKKSQIPGYQDSWRFFYVSARWPSQLAWKWNGAVSNLVNNSVPPDTSSYWGKRVIVYSGGKAMVGIIMEAGPQPQVSFPEGSQQRSDWQSKWGDARTFDPPGWDGSSFGLPHDYLSKVQSELGNKPDFFQYFGFTSGNVSTIQVGFASDQSLTPGSIFQCTPPTTNLDGTGGQGTDGAGMLNVPFVYQYVANPTQTGNACHVASMAMIILYYDPNWNKQFGYGGLEVVGAAGSYHLNKDYVEGISSLRLTILRSFTKKKDWTETKIAPQAVMKSILAGDPVMVYANSSLMAALSPTGPANVHVTSNQHWFVITGYDSTNKVYRISTPSQKYKYQYISKKDYDSGASITYTDYLARYGSN